MLARTALERSRPRLEVRLLLRVPTMLGIGGGVAALAVLSVHSAKVAVAVAFLVLSAGLAIYDEAILPALAVLGTLLVFRIGSTSGNLSTSDALLFVGTLAALPRFRLREDPVARRFVGLFAGYELALLVATLYNPSTSGVVEWVHEAFILAGGLVIGWTIGRSGRSATVLRWWLGASCVLAVIAVLYAFTHHLAPTNMPGGYQKNYVGTMLAVAAFTAYANPRFLALSQPWRRTVVTVCSCGLLASQSRQALIALIVLALVVAHRRGGIWSHARLLVLLTVPALVYVGIKANDQLVSSNRFNSLHQRLTWYQDSIHLFHLSPWLGEGLRWWYSSRFTFSFQPPNAELEMLTSAGILGLVAFVALALVALKWLWQLDPAYGTLAFGALAMRLLEGQFDVFWVGGETTIPFILVGVALGARVLARADGPSSPALFGSGADGLARHSRRRRLVEPAQ